MIRPHPRRWDWFEVDFTNEIGVAIGKVPGVVYARGKFEVHRTHLPLLGEEGMEALAACGAPYRSHVDREAEAASHDLVLRPNQQTGLDFIEPRRGVLCADEMRLGKTLTALLAHDPSRGPLVVVAPLSTRLVWLQWMTRLWPDIEPTVIVGRTIDPVKLTSSPIVFGHYDILTHHQIGSLRPGTLIVDEAHVLSNPHAERTKAVFFYASVAWRTILLTGTPLQNALRGLWPLLVATNPGAWGREFAFAQRYCKPTMTEYGWKYTGASNDEEWSARRNEMVIARRWSDVRDDLPPIQRTLEVVDLDPDQLMQVDKIAYELRRNVKVLPVEDLNYYRQATGIYKAEVASELAARVIKGGDHVVVWCWHKKVVDAIAKKLRKLGKDRVYTMTGADSITKRELAMSSWRASDAAALILTLEVGQVGIDLSRAHHAIFAEFDWTPLFLSQAEMRTFHPDRPMSITYVVMNHDVDHALIDVVMTKVLTGENVGFAAAGSTFAIPAENQREDEWLLEAFSQALRLSGPGDSVAAT